MKKENNKGYRNLIAWQKGMRIAELIYNITTDFPKEEVYGLTNQMRRASVSISSNIAEGQLRNSKKEFTQFISIALGSCAELSTQLELCIRLGYLSNKTYDSVSESVDELMKILHGLRRRMTNHVANTNTIN